MEWELFDGTEQQGPFTEQAVVEMIARGLKPETMVRPVGAETWKGIRSHAPFAYAFQSETKPVLREPAPWLRRILLMAAGVVGVLFLLFAAFTIWLEFKTNAAVQEMEADATLRAAAKMAAEKRIVAERVDLLDGLCAKRALGGFGFSVDHGSESALASIASRYGCTAYGRPSSGVSFLCCREAICSSPPCELSLDP